MSTLKVLALLLRRVWCAPQAPALRRCLLVLAALACASLLWVAGSDEAAPPLLDGPSEVAGSSIGIPELYPLGFAEPRSWLPRRRSLSRAHRRRRIIAPHPQWLALETRQQPAQADARPAPAPQALALPPLVDRPPAPRLILLPLAVAPNPDPSAEVAVVSRGLEPSLDDQAPVPASEAPPASPGPADVQEPAADVWPRVTDRVARVSRETRGVARTLASTLAAVSEAAPPSGAASPSVPTPTASPSRGSPRTPGQPGAHRPAAAPPPAASDPAPGRPEGGEGQPAIARTVAVASRVAPAGEPAAPPGLLHVAAAVDLEDLGGVALARSIVVRAHGILGGTGVVQGGLHNAGTVGPGHSPGLLEITDDFVQTAGGRLDIELAGTDPDEFDRVIVGGLATLSGEIHVLAIDGFEPQAGDIFDALIAQQIIDYGVSFVWPTLGDDVFLTAGILDLGGTEVLRLAIVPEPSRALLLACGLVALATARRRAASPRQARGSAVRRPIQAPSSRRIGWKM